MVRSVSKEVRWSEGAALAAGALAVAAGEVLHANDDGIKNLRLALRNYDREIMKLRDEDDLVVEVERKLTVKKSCNNCDFLGADPDGPYCGHPTVLADNPAGLNPSNALLRYCQKGVPPEETLWELRRPL